MTMIVTDQLLHQLVVGSHAEGTTRLAVAAAIEHNDRILLIAEADDDFQPVWQLPAGLVLPGETLLHGLDRVVTFTTGLGVIDVTGYAGHHDRRLDGEIVRTFVFTVTAADADRVCHWANIGHRWSSDPITACSILGDVDGHPTCAATPAAHLIGPTPIHQLSVALRANAKGLLCAEAAVDLLIKQQSWLHRRDFVDGFIDTVTANHSQELTPYSDTAFVDWVAALAALDAGRLRCSSGEGQLLRIAGSLAEGIPVNLRDAMTGLDTINTGLVARAICDAAGHRP
jgi:ADP-ribose pyrophosphatase YjhB (NUDIX family)